MATAIELGMAVAKPSAKIQSMADQLTGNQQSLDDLEEGEKQEEGPCGERTLKTRIAQGIAGTSIVMNLVAIVIEQSTVMVIAGIVALILAPIVIVMQFKLQDTGSMREVQNKLRRNVNQLQVENNKLSAENTLLEGEVSKLKEQEARLQLITAEQGSNVNQLVTLVKENKEIQGKMRSVVEAESVQSLIEVVLISDNDYDSKISENEIKRLKLRLDNLPGIQIDEEKLRKLLMGKELTIDGVFKLLKEMEALPEEDRIIKFS